MTKSNIPNGAFVVNEPQPFRIEEADGIVRLYLHGNFKSVEENTKLVSELHSLATKFNIVEVWVSSDGGYVTILTEILEALRQFDTVVTICNSAASSAGAMIWSLGNIRVTSPFAQFMWHRESYGYYGKTNQHEDVLENQKKVFPVLMDYCVGDILTQEEKDKAMYTEVHKSGQELIDGGFAMTFETYNDRIKSCMQDRFREVGTVYYDNDRGTYVIADDDGYFNTVGMLNTSDYRANMFDVGVGDHIRVQAEDGVTVFSAEEFNQLEEGYFLDVAEETGLLDEESEEDLDDETTEEEEEK